MNINHIFITRGNISKYDRHKKLNHQSFVIWFTGLSGSGKSTLSQALEKCLFNQGYYTYIIDGDDLRHGLCSDLSFTPEDRHENIRRAAEVTKLMVDAGLIVMTAFISPYQADRNLAKKIIGNENFIEVYCNCSLDVCEKRDVKGLYKRARDGVILNFTGIDAPYEAPIDPNISIDTYLMATDESIEKIIQYLKQYCFIE